MAERGLLRDVLYETAGRRRHDSDALRVCRDGDDGLGGRWTFADSDSVPQLECSGLKVAVHSAPQYQFGLVMEQRSQRPVQCLFLRFRTRLIWSRNRSPLECELCLCCALALLVLYQCLFGTGGTRRLSVPCCQANTVSRNPIPPELFLIRAGSRRAEEVQRLQVLGCPARYPRLNL